MPNILIVDDEKTIRLTIAQALESEGHTTTAAADGRSALEALQETAFDLMLLDLNMPGMDGMGVLRQATEQQPDLKVAIISAHGTVDNAVDAMKLGAMDFLQKPFTPAELRELVEQILGRSAAAADPADYEAQVAAARHYAGERQFDQAKALIKEAIGAHPEKPDAFNLLGELLEISGDRLEALKNYRVALDLDPTYEPAKANLSRATTDLKSRPSF
ncbi:MAG: response regulator [Leptolyngbya sp. SIO4C1]|nr:response regulator [Leptolyngbya sp. SIO4C1]